MVNKLAAIAISSILITTTVSLGACGNRARMETCRLIEIEDAEFEVEFGDIDAERGEVEMVCGDDILDVSWSQFRRRLNVNPGEYANNIAEFEQLVSCVRNERSRREEVFCQGPASGGEFVALNFSYDD